MTDTKLLIGSLSNDLLRVATMIHGKSPAAEVFFREIFRWVHALDKASVKPYIQTILADLQSHEDNPQFTDDRAETYLMYSVLLQNYALHMK